IARIEGGKGRGANVTVSELLVLAAALDVAPVHLIVPLEDEARLAITPTWQPTPSDARAWIRGAGTTVDGENLRFYYSEVPDREFEVLVRQSREEAGPSEPVAAELSGSAPDQVETRLGERAPDERAQAPEYYFDRYAGTTDAD